jgi:hypothetical protein
MKVSNLLIFILMTMVVPSVMGQTNLLNGYYITESNDTVRGLITYKSDGGWFKKIPFRANEMSPKQKLKPDDVIGFVVDEREYYKRYNFQTPSGEKLYGFFKVVVSGRLTLLKKGSRYFVLTEDSQFIEITKNALFKSGQLRSDFKGLGYLKVLMSDCENMSGTYLEDQYAGKPDYKQIFIEYNECLSVEMKVSDEIVLNSIVNYGVVINGASTSVRFLPPYNSANTEPYQGIFIGGFRSVYMPKLGANYRVVMEGTLGRFNQYSFFNHEFTNNDLFIPAIYLKAPVMLRYFKGVAFFDVGLQNVFILHQDIRWRQEFVDIGAVITNDKDFPKLNFYNPGVVLGIGAKLNVGKYTLLPSFRYTTYTSLINRYRPSFQAFEINAAIEFPKRK